MKNLKKFFLVSISTVLAASFLTGCSKEENSLYQAFNKNQEITSSEFNTDIGIRLSAENLSNNEKQLNNILVPTFNGLKINSQGKINSSENRNVFKMQSNTSSQIEGAPVNFSIWIDANLANGKNELKEVIKLPPEASKEMQGKQYAVIDTSKMIGYPNSNLNLTNALTDMQKGFSKLIESSFSKFNPEFNLISSTGYSYIDLNKDRKLVRTFEVNLNDKQFKNLIKQVSNNLIKDKDAKNLLKNYMITVIKMSAPTDEEFKTSENEINKTFSEFEKNLPQFTEKMNSILNAFDNIQIVGDKGINFIYSLDENGFIVKEKGNIDLIFNSEKIIPVFQQITGTTTPNKFTGIYTLGIDFNSNIFNINNKNIKIDLPQVNKDNSVELYDFTKTANKTMRNKVATLK